MELYMDELTEIEDDRYVSPVEKPYQVCFLDEHPVLKRLRFNFVCPKKAALFAKGMTVFSNQQDMEIVAAASSPSDLFSRGINAAVILFNKFEVKEITPIVREVFINGLKFRRNNYYGRLKTQAKRIKTENFC